MRVPRLRASKVPRPMRIVSLLPRLVLVPGVVLACSAIAEEKGTGPDFKEVRQVVRGHLGGATDESLNRAAVEGLLSALKRQVTLVTNAEASAASAAPLIAKQTLFEGNIGYARLARVESGAGPALASAVNALAASNKLA